MPQLRDLPSPPAYTEHVYVWWQQLHSSRQSAMGLQPLAWSEMLAYFQFIGESPRLWEIELIRAIDDEYLSVMNNDVEVDKEF